MSAPKQPGTEQAAAAPRRSLLPVPATRGQGQKLKKPVFCPAPCCVQARGGERPLGPDVPQLVPVDAEQAEEERGGELSPPLPNLGHLRRGRRRKRREEERKIKERLREIERLRIESESTSSEEEICQEMEMVTLDKMTKTRDCNGAVYNSTAKVENPVCETIQISGRLYIRYLPCSDHRDEQGDDSNIQDDLDDESEWDSNAEDDFKLEELQPEYDYDDTKFDTEEDDAAEANLDKVEDEEYETGDYDAVEADCLEPEDESIEGCEGEDLGQDKAKATDVLDDAPEEVEDEEHDEEECDDNDYEGYDDDYEEGYCDDDYECDDLNNYDSCNDCDDDGY